MSKHLVSSTGSEKNIVFDDHALGALFFLLEALFCEVIKPLDDKARGRAIKDVDGRAAHPGLQFVDGQWYVLGIVLVEHPDLSVRSRLRNAMPVVVE